MQVPFFRPSEKRLDIFERSLRQVVEHGQFILGPEVATFEKEFSAYCETSFCIGVASGCDALYLILKALKIKVGDEVIVPANTFIGSVLPILRLGAKPIFVDCSPIHFNIDIPLIEKEISSKTKAIIAVHLYGRPVEMDQLLKLAKKYNLYVIEDAAQAHGAKYHGQPCGSLAPYSAFSFYPSKNLGAFGDGGAVVTSDPAIASVVRAERNYGQIIKYHHDYDGWNSRLDTLQAVILSEKLKMLDCENALRRQHAQRYKEALRDLPIVIPEDAMNTEPVYHLFVLLTERRDKLAKYLQEHGVQTGIHYPIPCHLQKCVTERLDVNRSCPTAEFQADRLLSLPMFPNLTSEEFDHVVSLIRDFFNQYS